MVLYGFPGYCPLVCGRIGHQNAHTHGLVQNRRPDPYGRCRLRSRGEHDRRRKHGRPPQGGRGCSNRARQRIFGHIKLRRFFLRFYLQLRPRTSREYTGGMHDKIRRELSLEADCPFPAIEVSNL